VGEIKIFVTGDGSHSLHHESLNETYHSRHGAVQESRYVFIEQGLQYFTEQSSQKEISILEIGLGTGLNALLTATEAIKNSLKITYSALETFPLPAEVWTRLNYPDPQEVLSKIHQAEWNQWESIHTRFQLLKLNQSLLEFALPASNYDLIYFDAFAPSKQPEMWDAAVLEKVIHAMRSKGVFVTYCAKGQLKRDLKALGLIVESLAGPPGKREMVRALKP